MALYGFEKSATFPSWMGNVMQHIFSFPTAMALATSVVLLAGCHKAPERQTTQLLAEARAGETNFSSYAPKNPYVEAGNNLLMRTVLDTPGPDGIRIELRDLFVTPGSTADKVSLPGTAVLEVLSGEGKITTGEKSQELSQGVSVSLAQGATCSLESRGITPLVVRARIFIP
jgi:quercetin dioxygenase-like cupin family protein